jgi:hypothetical protein
LIDLKRQTLMSNLKISRSDPLPEIDWAAVDAAPLADVPDADSPELSGAQCAELRPFLPMENPTSPC